VSRVELIGQQFGHLAVLARARSTARRQARYLCMCRCGREVTVLGYALTSGIKRNCGECKNAGPNLRASVTVIGRRGERKFF
jgi:hypothetical protein